MTDTERLIIRNQFAILEFLTRAHPSVAQVGNHIFHDADAYRWYQRVLEGGYQLLLSEVTQHVQEVTLTADEQVEILDVLDMYRDLQHGFDSLKDRGDLQDSEVDFPGFDGNSPKGELSFAKTFCYRGEEGVWGPNTKPDRYSMIRPTPAHNSHWPTMGMYRRMLAVYRPIKERRLRKGFHPMELTEIQAVLQAGTYTEGA